MREKFVMNGIILKKILRDIKRSPINMDRD